jgi:hypothetical protein
MSRDNESRFARAYTKDQLKGRHHLTLTPPELNKAFLAECTKRDRVPSDLLRIILKERYSAEVHYPESVEVSPRGGERTGKREVA